MDYLRIFDYLSLAALVFMSFGIFRQWHHIMKTRSAGDIVLSEVAIRFVITAVLWIKIYLLHDPWFLAGQSIFLFSMFVYIMTLARIKSKS